MANPFKRDLQEGETMMVKKEILKPEFWAPEKRRVAVLAGFGMFKDTQGTKVLVRYLCDGETTSYSIYELEEDKDS